MCLQTSRQGIERCILISVPQLAVIGTQENVSSGIAHIGRGLIFRSQHAERSGLGAKCRREAIRGYWTLMAPNQKALSSTFLIFWLRMGFEIVI